MISTTTAHVADTTIRPHPVAAYRLVCDRIQGWIAVLGFVLCAVQISFAALGFWVGTENPGDEAAGRAAFVPHAVTGTILGYTAVVVLILGLLARSGWKAWVIPLVLGVLLFVFQGMLVGLGFEVDPWYGALHAFDGTIITAGFVWLAYDRLRHPLRAR